MAINIDIGMNVRDFQRGQSDIENGLEQTSDALDALAKASQRSAREGGKALSEGFEDGARDAERAVDRLGDDMGDSVKAGARDVDQETEKLERSFKELADSAKRDTSDLGDGMGKSVRRGTDDAKEGLGEFRDEANSTAKESAASFDGSAESIGDAFQEIAANAFAGFGPAGAVAGLAAAAGLGLVFAQVEKNDEKTQELRDQVAALAEEYINTGRIGDVSMSSVADSIRDMALATEDGETTLADLRKTADDAGVPFEKLAKAMAGDSDALDELIGATGEHIDALDRQNVSQDAVAGSGLRAKSAADNQRQALIDLRGDLEKQTEKQDQAAASAQNYADTNAAALARAAESSQDYAENVQDAYAKAGEAGDEYVENGTFNLQKYTEETKKQADAVAAYQLNMVTLSQTLSAEALAYVASLGPDAAPLIDAFVKAPLDQRQATADVWSKLGQTSTDAFGSKVQQNLNGANFQSTVQLNPDGSNIAAYLQQTKTQNVLLRVQNRIDLPANQGMGVP